MAWYDFLTGGNNQDEQVTPTAQTEGIYDDALGSQLPSKGTQFNLPNTTLKNILGASTWDQSANDAQQPYEKAANDAEYGDYVSQAGNSAIAPPTMMDKISGAFGSAGKALASPFSGLTGTQNTALAAAGLGTLGSVLGYKAGQAGQNAAMANQQAALDAANRLNVLKDPTVAAVQDNAQQLAARSTALQGLQDRATMGLTPQDMADLNNIRNQSNQQFQANQNQISENMQRRGIGNSGMGLAQSLGAAQAQQQNASQQGDQLAAMSFNAKQNALNNLSNTTNQMLTSDFNRNVTKAASTDAVSQFNVNQQSARDKAVQAQQNAMAQANIAKGTAQAQGIAGITQGIATGIGNVADSKNSVKTNTNNNPPKM